MALIICTNCNKKISNSTERCIHCGSPIKKTNEEAENATHTEKLKKYLSLSEDEQEALEFSFLKSNKKAMKFKRKGLEFKAASNFSYYVFFACIVVRTIVNYYVKKQGISVFNDFNATQEKLFTIASTILVGLFAISLLTMITMFIAKIAYEKSFKHYIYKKTYQKWLLEEKCISYQAKIKVVMHCAVVNVFFYNVMSGLICIYYMTWKLFELRKTPEGESRLNARVTCPYDRNVCYIFHKFLRFLQYL